MNKKISANKRSLGSIVSLVLVQFTAITCPFSIIFFDNIIIGFIVGIIPLICGVSLTFYLTRDSRSRKRYDSYVSSLQDTADILKDVERLKETEKLRDIERLGNAERIKDAKIIKNGKIIKDGCLKEYISQIKLISNNYDSEINQLLNDLIDVLQSMDNYLSHHQDKAEDIKIMAKYYIPEMIKHLKTYRHMKTSKFKSSHEEAIRLELIDAIKMIKDAFSTVLSEFYNNVALNVSASLEAIKASIKMKGLAK